MPISSKFALLVAVVAGNGLAQVPQPEPGNAKVKVPEEVRQAATDANVIANPLLVHAFVDAALNQDAAFANIYSSVPKNVRIARLARYLTAKKIANSSIPDGHVRNLSDFHWGYLARDINYASARLETPEEAKLLRVESVGGRYDFSTESEKIKPGMAVVLPAMNMTATFEIGDKKALWTGNPTEGIVKVVAASTSQGCEIIIRSKPSAAAVYFNGIEWYQPTNTSSVRDAGTWQVTVRREGYKEWLERRHLGPGESWTIDALLTKQ
jgi:hypothetical protein